jgi:nucleoside-diphosphate-sugar epimerase
MHAIAREIGASAPRLRIPYRALYAAGYAAERLAEVTGAKRQPVVSRLGVKLFGTDNRHAIDKAQCDLGYRPRVELREGVRLAAEWYRQRDSDVRPHVAPVGPGRAAENVDAA